MIMTSLHETGISAASLDKNAEAYKVRSVSIPQRCRRYSIVYELYADAAVTLARTDKA